MTHLQARNEAFTSLAGCVVVLTGGSSGIGRSAVEQFASYGAKVVFGDVQDDAGQAVAASAGPSVTYRHCDAGSYSDQLALFDTAKKLHGRVDIAVANAGVVVHKDLFTPESDWRQEPVMREIDINLKGALYTARIAQGYIRQTGDGGDIVLTSSISGFKECSGITSYTASKHGVLGLMRGLNLAAIQESIRINVICPWMTSMLPRVPSRVPADVSALVTNMTKGFEDSWIAQGLPTNQAADVARAILICASANRAPPQKGHGNAVLPFAGKIILVGGGESYEIEDSIQALEPQWMGPELSNQVSKGQGFLKQMADWDKPKNTAVNGH